VSMAETDKGRLAGLRRAFAYVGTHSYSIYLWHAAMWVATTIAIAHLPGQFSGYYPFATIYVLASVGVGIAMARIVELPVLRIRDRFFPAQPARQVKSSDLGLRSSPGSTSPAGP